MLYSAVHDNSISYIGIRARLLFSWFTSFCVFNCETKWWCCVYKIKTKKEKEGENPWQAVAVLPLEDECAMAFGDGLQW
jgi:hypothetical protein